MSAPFIALLPAQGPSLSSLYNADLPPSEQPNRPAPSSESPSSPTPPDTIPQLFIDAMTVRTSVFVSEQSVPLSAEFDSDDPRSFHWIAYASVSTSSTSSDTASPSVTRRTPVATIRLVPPPHPPDPYTSAPLPSEPFCKIGRLCTLKPYRGLKLARTLMDEMMKWAAGHADEVMGLEGRGRSEAEKAVEREKMRVGWVERSTAELGGNGGNGDDAALREEAEQEWRGLVLAHAQKELKAWYEGMGFKFDEEMGEWDEEGIMHVGMWKRLELKS
ncbi:MAG: hypothetical protein Q9165_006692 [Trypethelium subeluteriae]